MEAANPLSPPKNLGAKTLRTIDDPFFDEDDALVAALGAAGGALPIKGGSGGGLSGLPAGSPASGPPSARPSPGRSRPVGAEAAAGGVLKTDRVPQEPAALLKSELGTKTREAQNAERAKQRRVNVLIGAGVLGTAVVVLFILALVVFSGSRGNGANATVVTPYVSSDMNRTDYDYGDGKLQHRAKHETTPEEYEYENYEVTTPGQVGGSTTVKENGETRRNFLHAPEKRALKTRGGKVGGAVTTSPAKPTLSLSKAFTNKNHTLENSGGQRAQKRVVIRRIWQKSQNTSTYPQQEKTSNTVRELEDYVESAASAGNCSAPCKTRLAFLLDQLNPKFSPCENLYEHVCSNWQTRNSKLADHRGSYSVDESILDKFQASLARHLLTTDQVPFQESRQFFADCISGTLVTEGHTKLLGYLKTGHSASSAEALAETIVRASLVGVSPFFDVAVKKTGTDFSLTLLPPSFESGNQDLDHSTENFNWTETEGYQNGGRGENAGTDIVAQKAFLQALERQLCSYVVREHGSGANCSLTPDSDLTPPWNYEWYKSSGLRLLALQAASLFWPVLAAPAENETENEHSLADSRFQITNHSIRVDACLRLLERYDPDVVMHSALAVAGSEFVKRGKNLLDSLKTVLEHRIQGASNISLKFGSPLELTNHSPLLNHTSDHGGGLEKYLKAATWKRWTQRIQRPHEVFSVNPTLQRATSTLHVPLPVFDLTSSVQNRWLWHLSSMARVGPRFLKSFLLSVRSKQAYDSELLHCWGNQSTGNSEAKSKLASLDVEEVVSFAYSLEAFQSLTAGEPTANGYNVSTDALFLYYYVFNKCRALPSGEDHNKTSSTDLRRREVDSVAMAFGGSLLRECKEHPDIHSCFVKTMEQIESIGT